MSSDQGLSVAGPPAPLLPRLRQLWHVAPHAGAHHPALRLGVATLVPLVVLALLGRSDWSVWAVLGSVAAVYGRNDPPRRRLQVQAFAGGVLVVVVVAATALAATAPAGGVVVLCAAVVAGAATVIADLRRWTPPGSLFPVFGFAGCAALPATAADVARALALALAGLVWALLVTSASGVLQARWASRRGRAPGHRPPPPRPTTRLTLVHALMCVVAVGVAGTLAELAGLQHPAWALVAAVVPVVGPSSSEQLLRAGHRLAGTFGGVLVAGALYLIPATPLVNAILTGLLIVGTELLVARNYALSLLFITPVTIGMAHPHDSADLLALMADRTIENVLGVAVVALLIVATHRLRRPRRHRPADADAAALGPTAQL
ncbi:FUSC family protein [Pseudonocardia sp. RS11V-5]|uniref:FUSC family protein n=1 Tax=Pseudonocardia terrae TaxID=2905831 RepID=UPI001E60BFAB|nr:FUSC family protein [Pseudonocardia terrae]MCE3555799.1 FUSC family protein [Pseudonocardia terrae]